MVVHPHSGVDDALPLEAYWAALACLPGSSPTRLAAMAEVGPAAALRHIAAGEWNQLPRLTGLLERVERSPGWRDRWSASAASVDPTEVWAHHVTCGQQVLVASSPEFPSAFASDPSPPHILFVSGDPALLDRPAVAVVGTRRCTRYGHDLARKWAEQLSLAGVVVISGLAAGIDAAAHHGALQGVAAGGAPPVGIVGTGLDVPYPSRNAGLWRRVAEVGVLCSEYPAGTTGAPWHFPARNRLIAALAKAVVVVESHATGGSIITANEAHERGRTVLAVPGSVHSSASAGSNRLLADIASPCVEFDDLMLAVGAFLPDPRDSLGCGEHRPQPHPPSGPDAALLDAFLGAPASLQELAQRVDRPLAELTLDLTRLMLDGHVVTRGGLFERTG